MANDVSTLISGAVTVVIVCIAVTAWNMGGSAAPQSDLSRTIDEGVKHMTTGLAWDKLPAAQVNHWATIRPDGLKGPIVCPTQEELNQYNVDVAKALKGVYNFGASGVPKGDCQRLAADSRVYVDSIVAPTAIDAAPEFLSNEPDAMIGYGDNETLGWVSTSALRLAAD